jgi:hypothetical protein
MRNHFLLVLTGLLFAANLQALSTGEDKQQPTGQAVTQKYKPPASNSKQPGAPADTFTPTEKIGADSAVSFPVDI